MENSKHLGYIQEREQKIRIKLPPHQPYTKQTIITETIWLHNRQIYRPTTTTCY